jgi:hypothetical protein
MLIGVASPSSISALHDTGMLKLASLETVSIEQWDGGCVWEVRKGHVHVIRQELKLCRIVLSNLGLLYTCLSSCRLPVCDAPWQLPAKGRPALFQAIWLFCCTHIAYQYFSVFCMKGVGQLWVLCRIWL